MWGVYRQRSSSPSSDRNCIALACNGRNRRASTVLCPRVGVRIGTFWVGRNVLSRHAIAIRVLYSYALCGSLTRTGPQNSSRLHDCCFDKGAKSLASFSTDRLWTKPCQLGPQLALWTLANLTSFRG